MTEEKTFRTEVILVEGTPYSALDVMALKQDCAEAKSHLRKSISDMVRLAESTILPGITIDEAQLVRLGNLTGTPAFQALYILNALNNTTSIPGDVCEYGVATGRTSGLIGATLKRMNSDKNLWLYDSFEGLPNPSDKDVLLNDLYGLGAIEEYAGMFSIPEDYVRRELEQVQFPSERIHIHKGWIEAVTLPTRSPNLISFCYLDMDFYQSTKDVLNLLIERMPRGGVAIVDDYGFFSSGVKVAVEEIMAEHSAVFSLDQPFRDKFAILTRIN